MRITPNFTLHEMTLSDTAKRYGIKNEPTQQHLANLTVLCATLEQVRALVGRPIIVTSGYRSSTLNRKVGGSQTSAHCQGLAADINAIGMTPRALATAIAGSTIKFDQLILEFPEDGWVHLGLKLPTMRQQILTAKRVKGKTEYFLGLIT